MPNPALSAFVTQVRRAALTRPAEGAPTDGQLLTRFVRCRDDEAFAALVSRHGPMVLAVCRRGAGDPHLADDAFQAAFLVLARRAADVQPPEAVRAWLYGVAVRTARAARAGSARRRMREVAVPSVPDRPAPAASPADADALRMLDEEVARLPDPLRAAVVLCELTGVPRKDAAVRLGIPEGTLSSRLGKARKVLAGRLRGRGLALPATGLAALCGRAAATAGVPAALADAAGKLTGSGPVSAAVAELSRGVFQSMLLNQLKVVTTALLVAAAVGGVSAAVILRGARAEDPPARPAAAEAPVPKPAGPGHLFYSRDAALYRIDPDGKNERRIGLPDGAACPVPSPDGRSLAYWTEDGPRQASLHVCGTDGKADGKPMKLPDGLGFLLFCWSPDGTELHVSLGSPGKRGVQHLRVDVRAHKATPLHLLPTHLVESFSPDGKFFITTEVGDGDEWEPKRIYLMNRDGTEHRALTGPNDVAQTGRLSPDGKRLLLRNGARLCVMDVGKPESLTPVEGIAEEEDVVEYAWSPDGKRIAYTVGTMRPLSREEFANQKSRLVVADPDGKNARVLRSGKGTLIMNVYWR
jgi:RNA polymerase sigma factor (sigma-70 family)